jgi:hypothetical protein
MREGLLSHCIIKQQYKNGERLSHAITWCGIAGADHNYLNAHHAAISERRDVCEQCKAKLIDAIKTK